MTTRTVGNRADATDFCLRQTLSSQKFCHWTDSNLIETWRTVHICLRSHRTRFDSLNELHSPMFQATSVLEAALLNSSVFCNEQRSHLSSQKQRFPPAAIKNMDRNCKSQHCNHGNARHVTLPILRYFSELLFPANC